MALSHQKNRFFYSYLTSLKHFKMFFYFIFILVKEFIFSLFEMDAMLGTGLLVESWTIHYGDAAEK